LKLPDRQRQDLQSFEQRALTDGREFQILNFLLTPFQSFFWRFA
jgi:hypothetical protein